MSGSVMIRMKEGGTSDKGLCFIIDVITMLLFGVMGIVYSGPRRRARTSYRLVGLDSKVSVCLMVKVRAYI